MTLELDSDVSNEADGGKEEAEVVADAQSVDESVASDQISEEDNHPHYHQNGFHLLGEYEHGKFNTEIMGGRQFCVLCKASFNKCLW